MAIYKDCRDGIVDSLLNFIVKVENVDKMYDAMFDHTFLTMSMV